MKKIIIVLLSTFFVLCIYGQEVSNNNSSQTTELLFDRPEYASEHDDCACVSTSSSNHPNELFITPSLITLTHTKQGVLVKEDLFYQNILADKRFKRTSF
jgi:hypothetical protein